MCQQIPPRSSGRCPVRPSSRSRGPPLCRPTRPVGACVGAAPAGREGAGSAGASAGGGVWRLGKTENDEKFHLDPRTELGLPYVP